MTRLDEHLTVPIDWLVGQTGETVTVSQETAHLLSPENGGPAAGEVEENHRARFERASEMSPRWVETRDWPTQRFTRHYREPWTAGMSASDSHGAPICAGDVVRITHGEESGRRSPCDWFVRHVDWISGWLLLVAADASLALRKWPANSCRLAEAPYRSLAIKYSDSFTMDMSAPVRPWKDSRELAMMPGARVRGTWGAGVVLHMGERWFEHARADTRVQQLVTVNTDGPGGGPRVVLPYQCTVTNLPSLEP